MSPDGQNRAGVLATVRDEGRTPATGGWLESGAAGSCELWKTVGKIQLSSGLGCSVVIGYSGEFMRLTVRDVGVVVMGEKESEPLGSS